MTLAGVTCRPYTVCIMLQAQPGRFEPVYKMTQPAPTEARLAASTRLLIIDDRETVRQALNERLGHAPELDLVGSVGSTEEGLKAVHALSPDVVLLEIKMADGSGLDACRRIIEAAPSVNVIVLTSYMDEAERLAAFQAGASGYVLKDIDSQRLIRAIESICRNRARPGA
jgi:two-component system response regulator DevR